MSEEDVPFRELPTWTKAWVVIIFTVLGLFCLGCLGLSYHFLAMIF